jgi:hypothetical protein
MGVKHDSSNEEKIILTFLANMALRILGLKRK